MSIITERIILANKSDIALLDRAQSRVFLVDITIPYDENLVRAETEIKILSKKPTSKATVKYASGTFRKKKYQAKSEPSDFDFRSRSGSRSRSSSKVACNSTRKLVGILKHTERESSEDDEDYAPQPILFRSQDRCLVGQVPRPPGTKPGRGGGVAILVRKNVSNLPSQQSSTSSTKRKKPTKRLSRKRSY